MVTFANLGSVRLPSLKFVGLRIRKIRRIQCVSCLSTTVSPLFEPQLQKISHFYVPRPSFFVCPGDAPQPCGNHAKRCMNEKTVQKVQKQPFSRTAAHIFVSHGDAPLRSSRNMLHEWKDKSMLSKPLAACTYLYLQQFPSYTMLKSMRKSKNRYFDHIFVSPGDAPGAITLNVV